MGVSFVLRWKFIPLNYPDNIPKDWVDDIDVLNLIQVLWMKM